MIPKFEFFISTYGLPLTLGFIALIIWSTVWKGIALWKATKSGDKRWFTALLVINTAGILDILYIYVFSRKK